MAPARQIGGSTFGDSLPKACPSCPLALRKDRAVSLLPAWDAGREQGLDRQAEEKAFACCQRTWIQHCYCGKYPGVHT